MEYLLESSEIAHKRGLKNILVSNGYVNPEPANELLELLDAANIDLKAYNPEFYKQEIGGNLEDVKRFISLCAKKIHCEVTTLIIPTKNSTEKEVEEIARFLASVNPEIPLHLSCYFPTYKYTIPPTPPDMVERLALVAGKYLSFVYIGNAGRRHSDTCCPECDNLLVRRIGYTTEIVDLKNGFCGKCGKKIPIKGV
jgi:pyruvate formate lyase activating enzyme